MLEIMQLRLVNNANGGRKTHIWIYFDQDCLHLRT